MRPDSPARVLGHGAAPNQGLEGGVAGLARDLVRAFKVALRTIRFHDAGNEAAVTALDAFAAQANDLFRLNGVHALNVMGEYLFWNDVRLKPDISSLALFDSVCRELAGRGVGSLTFHGVVERRDVQRLLSVLTSVPVCHPDSDEQPSPEAWRFLNERLGQLAPVFELGPPKTWESDLAREQIDSKEKAKRAFFRAVAVTRALMSGARVGHDLDLRRAKRVVQTMVDMILEEEFSLIGLTTIRQYDSYTFFHCVNVCVLSIALGKRLGLERQQLSELGVAALFHDIGKTEVSTEVLRKPGKFTPEEWAIMKMHPALGVRVLLRLKGLSDLAVKAIVVAFEHHLGLEGRGYPELEHPRDLHLFSRIVAITDAFDAMTTRRVYVAAPFGRDQALAEQLRYAGRSFDGTILKEFINLIGVYPVGSLVRLTDGRVGVVMATAPEPGDPTRPRVRLVRDEMGEAVVGPDLDLTHDVGAPAIAEVLDPEKAGIDPSPCFV